MPDLTDKQWEKLKPLLPPQKPPTGRPGNDLRMILNGILWIEANPNKSWRQLPKRYGPWSTVANRYYRWRKSGVWERFDSAIEKALKE
jgi:transposase